MDEVYQLYRPVYIVYRMPDSRGYQHLCVSLHVPMHYERGPRIKAEYFTKVFISDTPPPPC